MSKKKAVARTFAWVFSWLAVLEAVASGWKRRLRSFTFARCWAVVGTLA